MQNKELDCLFNPRSVAIVGVSSDTKKIGGRIMTYLKAQEFPGKIYPVNPKYNEISGIKCYSSLESIPDRIDQVILAVPARQVLGFIESARKTKPKCIVIVGGGFAEAGADGGRDQKEIEKYTRETGLRVLGPNCLGIMNMPKKFVSLFVTLFEVRAATSGHRIAYVGQSGAVGTYTLALLQNRGSGLNVFASTGNEVDVSSGECVEYLAYDSNVDIFILYLEGCRDGAKLIKGLQAAANQKKPVIVIKVGKSMAAARASASHTASIVGMDDAYNAIFEKYGAYRVDDAEEAADLALTLTKGKVPTSKRIGIGTISGGLGVLLTDRFIDMGLEVPNFREETVKHVKELVSFAGANNPLDLTAVGADNPDILRELIMSISEDQNVDAIVSHMQYNMLSKLRVERYVEVFLGIAKASKKPFYLCGLTDKEVAEKLCLEGVNYYSDTYRCVKTVFNAVKLYETMQKYQKHKQLPNFNSSTLAASREKIVGLINRTEGAEFLDEYDSKQVMKYFGIPSVEEKVACSEEEAMMAANQIGYPVVVKVLSADIAHKTDANAVILELFTESDVKKAFNQVISNAKDYNPSARIRGVVVQKMIIDKNAKEIIIGMIKDAVFGPIITVGLGGIGVELYKDKAVGIPPLSVEESLSLIYKLKTARVLEGFRGSIPLDIEALADSVSRFSEMACLLTEENVVEMEINPLRVLPKGNGVVALDALIRVNSIKEME